MKLATTASLDNAWKYATLLPMKPTLAHMLLILAYRGCPIAGL
jgi:hypothetical protein